MFLRLIYTTVYYEMLKYIVHAIKANNIRKRDDKFAQI